MSVNVCRVVNGLSTEEYADDGMDAEQILSQFAEHSGIDLSDVVSSYSLYASDIQRSFAAHCSMISPHLYVSQCNIIKNLHLKLTAKSLSHVVQTYRRRVAILSMLM